MSRSVSKEIRENFIDAAIKEYGNIEKITRQEVLHVCEKYNISQPNWLLNDPVLRYGRGIYWLKSVSRDDKTDNNTENSNNVDEISSIQSVDKGFVPTKTKGYVPFGHYKDVYSIIKSELFYPTFITGLSGNGKTLMAKEVCANIGREMFRANITIETDEDDLLGGFRLYKGETIWEDGPVITAMKRGGILLLDEVDLGSNKLMCLQPVLEGQPIFLKKINKIVKPEPGFNIIATANTKGKGSDDGRFIGTNVMNEAFLERFSITLEQDYPPIAVENKILNNVLTNRKVDTNEETLLFTEKLVTWAEVIRKSFYEGALNDVITTRRLVHICDAYAIFKNKIKSIELCTNRFDVDTKNAFIDLYKKVDETIESNFMAKSKKTEENKNVNDPNAIVSF